MSRDEVASDQAANAPTGLGQLRRALPAITFIAVHSAYFVCVCLVASLIFWASSTPAFSIGYVDSLFLVVSAMTEAGLNTVNLSQINTWQQVILFVLILFGGSIWVSIWTVLARKHTFERRFDDIVAAERARSAAASPSGGCGLLDGISRFHNGGLNHAGGQRPIHAGQLAGHRHRVVDTSTARNAEVDQISPAHSIQPSTLRRRQNGKPGPGVEITEEKAPGQSRTLRDFLDHTPIGRNGQFRDLTSEERDQLGGCEYRALKLLAAVVPAYFVLWQLLGCFALAAWINTNLPQPALENGINPVWLGIFNGVSAFNNSGMSLLDANVIPFGQAYFVLVTMALMILAGNTAYPIFLRLIFWTWLKVLRATTADEAKGDLKATLEFILRYPRRVYTNLFPARPTWWLLFMVVLLNSIDWAAFELLNIGNPVIEAIPKGARVLDGLFQAVAVRSGGFYVVPMTNVYIGLQILYVIMMYISVYPVVITMRHSNVYEERSLGIYADEQPPRDAEAGTAGIGEKPHPTTPRPTNPAIDLASAILRNLFPFSGVGAAPAHQDRSSRAGFISQQIHGQLAHDIWWLVLAVLAISTLETGRFLADPVAWSVFNVIFEVVSAYGCVGISVGVPFDAFSFSGGWRAESKLVLCLVMLRGRHRGLPVALDRAVMLPGEGEEEE